jgi:radical SAM protein with 4Fe4S-binding SPASM domain
MDLLKTVFNILIKKIWRLTSLFITTGPKNTYARLFKPRLKNLFWILSCLRHGGLRYVYNVCYMSTFYGTTNPLVRKWLQKFSSYPFCIEVETTTRCNFKCVMCEHTYWKEPPRNMTFEEFKNILEQFPKLKWIGLTGIGESFLNRNYIKMLWLAKSRGIFIEIFDHLFLINQEVAGEIIQMKLDRIIASIDGATKQTYEKVRVGSDFDVVIANLRNLIRLKKEKKAFFPRIDIHYIISKYNYLEAPKFVEFVHSFGANEINELRFTRTLHNYPEISNLYIQVPQEIISEVEEKSFELGVNMVWGSDVPMNKPPASECVAWIMPFIFVTGHVIPCCAENEKNDREFQKKHSMGNIFEQPFKEIWYGEKYAKFREDLFSGKIPVQCITCPVFSTQCSGRFSKTEYKKT